MKYFYIALTLIFSMSMVPVYSFNYTDHTTLVSDKLYPQLEKRVVPFARKLDMLRNIIETKLQSEDLLPFPELLLHEIKDYIDVAIFTRLHAHDAWVQDAMHIMGQVQAYVQEYIQEQYPSVDVVPELTHFWRVDHAWYSIITSDVPWLHIRHMIDTNISGTKWGIHDDRLRPIVEYTKEYLLDYWFGIDSANSSQEYSDDRFVDYILAFRKDNLRCKITADPGNGASWYEYLYLENKPTTTTFFHLMFSCVDVNMLEKASIEQIPLVQAWRTYSWTDGIVFLRPGQYIGDFIMWTIHFLRTGGVFWMVDVGEGRYEYVWWWQDRLLCENFLPYAEREGYATMMREHCVEG